jgi:hypothetical protein
MYGAYVDPMRMTRTLDAATVRKLAVRASVDPRTIMKVFKGNAVKGDAGNRARAVLLADGFIAEDGKPRK